MHYETYCVIIKPQLMTIHSTPNSCKYYQERPFKKMLSTELIESVSVPDPLQFEVTLKKGESI